MKFLSDILAKAGLTVDGVVTLNNTATGQTPDANDNSTKLATTAWVRTFVQPYSLPIASASVLGGIKVGAGLSINPSTGVLSASAAGISTRDICTFIATAGQTTFSCSYTVDQVDVFYNGSKLGASEFTASNGTTVVLNTACKVGDYLEIVSWVAGAGLSSSRTITINGVTYDLTANRSWSALPVGGVAGDILAKVDGTDYNATWIPNYTSQVQHYVKLSATMTAGTAVYVSGSTGGSGTNMIVSKASNASEATSSKTLGLLKTGGVTNDEVFVVTEGLLAGLDTSTANAGDPVWLGTNGGLIFGLLNKPTAPAHLVFIGVVTRVQSNNGEIFVKVQNGFELDELHNLSVASPSDGDMIKYVASTGLWTKIAASTTNIVEGTNLYYTTARANTDFDTRLATKSTSNLSEGTNLYYTDTRVGTYLTNNSYATQTYVNTAVSNLVDAAPGTLDTLNELAAALGDDPNFATTVATSIGTKVPNTRTITINGTAYDLSADRSWTINSMVYPGAGIAVSTGSAWGTSITNNSTNWNTAYGWGNHASAGYLTGITSSQVTTALGYTPYNSSNPSGYISSYTETSTLANVTSRGNTTTTSISATNFQNAYQVLSLNNIKTPGLYNYDGGISGTQPLGTEWYNIRTIEVGADSRYSQFVMPYNVDRIFYRRKSDAGFAAYVELYHTGNLPTIPTNNNQLTNGAGYITSAGNAATATTLSSGQSNWSGTGVLGNVVGMLAWKNYGNSHVIFDASAGTSPSGGGVSQTNATIAWTATYPTLMGWNGTSTYGVRVDSARVADSLSSMNISQFTNNSGYVTTSGLSTDSDSEQLVGGRIYYFNDGVRRMNLDPRWNESGYDADLGCLHLWSWTAAGVAYGRAGIAFYNGSAYQYLTTQSGTTGIFVNNNAILHAGNYTSYTYSTSSANSTFSRKDTTGQWIKPYYEYGSYLTTELPSTLTSQMGGGGLRVDFQNPGGTGDWSHTITWSGYNRYSMCQIGTNYNTTDARLYYRQTSNHSDSWLGWKEMVFTTGNTPSIMMSGPIRRASHSSGFFEGSYNNIGGNSAYSNPIYTIGSSYNPSDSSLGVMYGIGYAHPNFWGGGKTSSWGMYCANGGVINVTLGEGSTSIWAQNDIVAYSDIRVKDNIEVIDNALEKIQAIRGVTFTRKDAVAADINKRHAGVIAQEVLTVLPEVVSGTEEDMYSVAYGNMAGLFIEAIKELKAENDALKEILKRNNII